MTDFSSFVSKLDKRLKLPLPAWEAHKMMASARRLNDHERSDIPENAIDSSVLITLFPHNQSVYTLFIVRKDNGGIHGGQIAFPGGKAEEVDHSFEQTALRESLEEISLDPSSVRILGRLSTIYIPPSNYLVYPVLGLLDQRPVLRPDMHEVADILEADLFYFREARSKSVETINVRGHLITIPCYRWDGHIIWGATAMMLSELLSLISD